MGSTKLIAVLVLISLAALPAMAELTDYQKGVQEGIKAGFAMGQAYQGLNDGAVTSDQYGQTVNSFNSFVQAVFAGNQTAINQFLMNPQATRVGTGYQAYPSAINKPVHAIDASWNQTATYNPDVKGTVYGMPADAYYTWTGNWPAAPKINGQTVDSSLGSI